MGRTSGEISDTELTVHLAGGTADEHLHLQRAFGRRGHWLALDPCAWRRAGLRPARVDALARQRARGGLQLEVTRARALGVRFVAHRHEHYPVGLRELAQPPLLLNVRGRWPPCEQALAIVGSRAATAYGRANAVLMAETAVQAGFAVVSGLARGIDRCALQATLDAGGWPVGVLGCGLDVVYPPENGALQAAVANVGTLVSEFPLGTRPDRWTFPRRNRILAGLSRAVLVIEAGARSGALITAGWALGLGRDVWAVPGPIDSTQSQGTNRLIFDGAQPVIDPAVLLELLGTCAAPTTTIAPGDPLLRGLGRRALSVDELAQVSGLELREVRSRLIGMELEGRVQRIAGGLYKRR